MAEESIVEYAPWHLCGMTVFVLLWVVNRRVSRSNILVLALWHLCGVILHESAHLLAGVLLRAGPSGFSLFPRRCAGGWRLGSVTCSRLNPLTAPLVALAPLGLIAVAYLVGRFWFEWFEPAPANIIALYPLLFILLYNALPSRQDLRIACGWRTLALYTAVAVLAAAAWYLLPR